MHYDFDDVVKREKLENTIATNYNVILFYYNIITFHIKLRFDKIDRFIRIYDGTRYLVLFGSENYGAIYKGIRYLISLKSSITYVSS